MSAKVKRSRIGRSSSQGEICMFDQIKPIESPTIRWEKLSTVQNSSKISKPSVVKSHHDHQHRRKILILGSPVKETKSNDGFETRLQAPIGGFFEACYSCKKKINEKDDIFMYSYLRAFCSPRCRDKQIALDKELEKISERSNATRSKLTPKKMNGLPAAQIGKTAVTMFHI